jgi:signal peptidase II
LKKAILTILLILILDQWLKVWIKLNFHYGESVVLIKDVIDIQFVENPGMAFGWMIPGNGGKLALSIFRLFVVCGIGWYLYKLIRQKAHTGYIICMSMIVAGALGNIFDSLFYGILFDRGSVFDPEINDYTMYFGVSTINLNDGYAPPLLGNVVDMFHFTMRIPWGEGSREIFPPIFNIADSSISLAIIVILLFQKKFFPKPTEEPVVAEVSESPVNVEIKD